VFDSFNNGMNNWRGYLVVPRTHSGYKSQFVVSHVWFCF